jgi:hypothetical protein
MVEPGRVEKNGLIFRRNRLVRWHTEYRRAAHRDRVPFRLYQFGGRLHAVTSGRVCARPDPAGPGGRWLGLREGVRA